MADASVEAGVAEATTHPGIRKIGLTDLRDALARGIDDFLTVPTQLVFLGIIYPLVGLVAVQAASGRDLLPLVYPLIAGLSLLGPVLAVGLYEMSRRREQGLPVSWTNAFDVLRSPNIVSIIMLGLLLFALFVTWLASARAIYDATIGYAPATLGALIQQVLDTPAGWRLILFGNLVGFLFAVAALALSVVSFPMLVDRNVGPLVAAQTSVRAVLANPLTLAVWGLIVAGLLVLGCLPFFIGLAVVMPVLGHATWHLYRRVVA